MTLLCLGRALSYLAGAGVNTGDVDARDELDGGRVIGIVGSAVDVHTVYAVFVDALIVD
jgi:hypothetical protein